ERGDRRKAMALLETIRSDSEEKLDGVVHAALTYVSSVTTRAAFRPSLRDAQSVIARLWRVVQTRTPEQMVPPSKAFADALNLPDTFEAEWHESLSSVLRRPSGGEMPSKVRFARNALVTIATSCQLVTAAAHADSYSQYPVPLLRSVSYDLRRSL